MVTRFVFMLLLISIFSAYSEEGNTNDTVTTDSQGNDFSLHQYLEIRRQTEPFLILESGMNMQKVLRLFPKAQKSEDNGAPTLVMFTPQGHKVTLYFHKATNEFSSAWLQISSVSCALPPNAENILLKGIAQKWTKIDVVRFLGLPNLLTIPDRYWRYGTFDVIFDGEKLLSAGIPTKHPTIRK